MEKLDVVFMSQNLGIGLKTLISNRTEEGLKGRRGETRELLPKG